MLRRRDMLRRRHVEKRHVEEKRQHVKKNRHLEIINDLKTLKNSFKKNKNNISVKTENTRMHKSSIHLSNFLSLVSIYLSLLPPYLPVYLPWHLNIIYLYRSFSKSLYPLAVSSLSKSFQPMILDTRISGNCSGWSVSLQIKVNFMSKSYMFSIKASLFGEY